MHKQPCVKTDIYTNLDSFPSKNACKVNKYKGHFGQESLRDNLETCYFSPRAYGKHVTGFRKGLEDLQTWQKGDEIMLF